MIDRISPYVMLLAAIFMAWCVGAVSAVESQEQTIFDCVMLYDYCVEVPYLDNTPVERFGDRLEVWEVRA